MEMGGSLGSPNNPFASGDANPFAGGGNPYAPQPGPNPYQPPGSSPFHESPQPTSSMTFTGPPTGLLVAAAAVAVLGLAVGIVSLFLIAPLSVLGWVLAGPVAIGLMALYLARDTARRSAAIYVRPDWVKAAYGGVVVLFVVAVLVTAYAVADWVGRM